MILSLIFVIMLIIHFISAITIYHLIYSVTLAKYWSIIIVMILGLPLAVFFIHVYVKELIERKK